MAYNAELYMHELDKRAFEALNKFPKLVKLREAYLTEYSDKASKIELMAGAVRLGNNQMPEIYNLLPPICEKLGIAVPEIYYVKSKEMNAATGGCSAPYIYVTSKLVDKLPQELISSVLAHECGHIACGHYLYHSIAQQLIRGVDKGTELFVPMVNKYLTKTLVKSLLFWDRCSELSADRAAVLCDGTADKIVDMLLRIHGYGDNINREEFIKQSLDLKAFVNDSKSNQLLEQMVVQWNSHPMMATRVYECCDFAQSSLFQGIIDGTYTLENLHKEENAESEDEEIITADVAVEESKTGYQESDVDAALKQINVELEKYTNKTNCTDYAFAVFSGLMAGAIDAMFVGEIQITEKDIGLSHQQVNNFIQHYAKARGYDKSRLQEAIQELENNFKVAQDNVWKGAGIGVTPKNHHLADLAHHPTPLGLMSALVVQFLRIGTFVNKDGEWHFIFVKTTASDVIQMIVPAVISGMLNWFVSIAESNYEEETGRDVPQAVHKLAHIVASSPMIIEVAKCVDNWFAHLASDMGGSKNTAGGGMGIPGIFVSLLYELSGLPILKDSGLPAFVNDLYVNKKIDLRHEIPLYKAAGKQALPVLFNEVCVRTGYFVFRLVEEIEIKGLKGINWNNVVPFGNRTVNRMLMAASMTFTVADTTDAAVHAALESAGNWVLFSGRFVTRFNYVGAGHAALSIVKEISAGKKEAQLIHEKLILTEAKTEFVVEQLEKYKQQLTECVSNYLAEDLEAFFNGMDDIQTGLASQNADLVIKGNITIQKVLGREPQFTNLEEFDSVMKSDAPIIL